MSLSNYDKTKATNFILKGEVYKGFSIAISNNEKDFLVKELKFTGDFIKEVIEKGPNVEYNIIKDSNGNLLSVTFAQQLKTLPTGSAESSVEIIRQDSLRDIILNKSKEDLSSKLSYISEGLLLLAFGKIKEGVNMINNNAGWLAKLVYQLIGLNKDDAELILSADQKDNRVDIIEGGIIQFIIPNKNITLLPKNVTETNRQIYENLKLVDLAKDLKAQVIKNLLNQALKEIEGLDLTKGFTTLVKKCEKQGEEIITDLGIDFNALKVCINNSHKVEHDGTNYLCVQPEDNFDITSLMTTNGLSSAVPGVVMQGDGLENEQAASSLPEGAPAASPTAAPISPMGGVAAYDQQQGGSSSGS